MKKQLDDFAEQLTIDESLTPVSIMIMIHVPVAEGKVLVVINLSVILAGTTNFQVEE